MAVTDVYEWFVLHDYLSLDLPDADQTIDLIHSFDGRWRTGAWEPPLSRSLTPIGQSRWWAIRCGGQRLCPLFPSGVVSRYIR